MYNVHAIIAKTDEIVFNEMVKLILPILAAILVLFVGVYISGRLAIYQDFPHFDKVMHTLGGATVVWILLAGRRNSSFKEAFVFALSVGLLWELAEWSSGHYFSHISVIYKYFHGGDFLDTITDIFFDLVGGLVAYGFFRGSHPLKRPDPQEA